MATFRMTDGNVVKTENASGDWPEKKFGIFRVNGTKQHLYRSRRGRFYIVHFASYSHGHRAEWVSNEEAARWLIVNEHQLPDDLAALAEEVCE